MASSKDHPNRFYYVKMFGQRVCTNVQGMDTLVNIFSCLMSLLLKNNVRIDLPIVFFILLTIINNFRSTFFRDI